MTQINDEYIFNPFYKATKEDIKIDDKTYTAFFPQKHSTVSGIVYSWDLENEEDNLYCLNFYVKYKNSDSWCRFLMDDMVEIGLCVTGNEFAWNKTYHDALYALEKPKVKRLILLIDRTKYLSEQLIKVQKELSEVKEEYEEIIDGIG